MLKTFADLYAKGDFLNAWLELEKVQGDISPGLWHFNAGILKAKMDKPAEARFHFLSSLAEGYRDENVFNNLSLVEDQLGVKSVEKPIEISDYGTMFALWAKDGFFTTLSLVILVCGLLILKREKKIVYLALTIFLMMIPIGGALWVRSWSEAINLQPVELREGPSVIFASRGEVPAGVHLIARNNGEWYEIQYPSRFRGWIKANEIKELE